MIFKINLMITRIKKISLIKIINNKISLFITVKKVKIIKKIR
jgi:hypothetical protein